MRTTTYTVLLALAISVGGCASENAVGSDALLDVDDSGTGQRLGALERIEDPAPEPAGPTDGPSSPPSPSQTPTPTVTQAPPPPPQPTQVQPSYEPMTVELTENGFDPVHLRVWAGTEVRFVNATAETRSLTGLDDGWSSGPIKAGGVATYPTSQPGQFNVEDDTRVYYVARIEVLQP